MLTIMPRPLLLPVELKHLIATRLAALDVRAAVKLSMADRGWHLALDNKDFWKRLCHVYGIHRVPGAKHAQSTGSYKRMLLEEAVRLCFNCLLRSVDPLITSPLHELARVCRRCDEALEKISITKAKHVYKVRDEDFLTLLSEKKDRQTWYLVHDVLTMALRKHGGPEGLYEAQMSSLRRLEAIDRKKAERQKERRLQFQASVEARGHVWRDELLRVHCVSQYVIEGRLVMGSVEALVAHLECWMPAMLMGI